MGQVLKVRNGGMGSKRAGRARAEARTKAKEPRTSLYDEVTARIVAELEAGRFPWVQPWDSDIASPGLPRNAVTGRAYSGVNVLILWGEVIAKAYANQGWLTFRQALAAGGYVRKGERGVPRVGQRRSGRWRIRRRNGADRCGTSRTSSAGFAETSVS